MKTIMLALLLAGAVDLSSNTEIRLIAHRGGVVDVHHAENTLASLQEAIKQGYWMVEVDVQRSGDGELVVLHDDNFMRVYGANKKVANLTWDEISRLRSRIGGQPPCTFAEYAAQCRGKIRVMMDSKETGGHPEFFEKMEEILRANDLLNDALFIGSGQMKAHFKGKSRIGTDRDGLKKAVAAGEDVSSLYFLFEHGTGMDDDAVKYAQSLKVPVVPTVNDFHYLMKHPASATPQSDIERLKRAGATLFQIDSAYAAFCR
jgi:glycerophosphoryl diester phosphodiesterase